MGIAGTLLLAACVLVSWGVWELVEFIIKSMRY